MVEFICDDKKVEKVLKTLCEQVRAYGGFIHEKIIFKSRQGDITVHTPDDIPQDAILIILPKDCLLPTEKYALDLEGDDIVLKGHDSDLTEGQVAIMEALLAMYNVTNKIATHRKISTAMNYVPGSAFYEKILALRDREGIYFLNHPEKQDDNESVIASFFKTRVLGFRAKLKPGEESDDNESAPGYSNQRTQVLMPLTELINHHSEAKGFLTNLDYGDIAEKTGEDLLAYDGEGVTVVKSCPVEGSDESFVCYGAYDALDTFLNYNFPERHAVFVRSVPVVVTLPGLGSLNIRSFFGGKKHKNLPEQIRDLAFYLPRMSINQNKNSITLVFLYISQDSAPRALRRVIALALRQLDAGLGNKEMMAYVKIAEKEIINENLKHFTALVDYLKSSQIPPNLKPIARNAMDMAQIQIGKIRNYPFFEETQDNILLKKTGV